MIRAQYAAMAEDAQDIADMLNPATVDLDPIRGEARRLLYEASRRLKQLAGEEVPVVGQ